MPLRERPRATVAVGRAGEAHFFSRGEALGERMGRQVCRPSFLPGKLLFLIRKAPANVTDNVGNSNHLWGVQCVDLMIMKKGYDPRRRSVFTARVNVSFTAILRGNFFLPSAPQIHSLTDVGVWGAQFRQSLGRRRRARSRDERGARAARERPHELA